MSFRNYINKIKPNFEKGGRFYALRSTFEAFETFLFVPDKVTFKGSHVRDPIDMKRAMIVVVIALLPPLLFGMWNTGFQHSMAMGLEKTIWQNFGFGFLKVLPIIVVSYVTGLGIEFIFAQIKHHEVNEGFLVTGMLIPLVMPVDVPLWMVALSTAFAVIIGKEVFGGTGMNVLNPALTARAFLFFAYPAYMSGDLVWISGLMKGEGIIDGFSGATALAQAEMNNGVMLNGIGQPITPMDMFIGTIPGSIGETSTLAILLGALFLIYTGIGSWKIILSFFTGGLVMGIDFKCCRSQFIDGSPCMAASYAGRFCIRRSIYGNRSCYGCTNRNWEMDIRIPCRIPVNHGKGCQWCFSGGSHACNTPDERICTIN